VDAAGPMELFSEANTFLDSGDRYETVLVSRGGLFRSDFQGRQAQRVRDTGAVRRVGFRTVDNLHCFTPRRTSVKGGAARSECRAG
jgi:hypothetical protein